MKNLLRTFLLIIPFCLNAQKFNNINHGTTYNQIKEVSEKEFKRNCDGFISGSRYRFPYMFSSSATFSGQYASSKFEGELRKKSEKLWLEYSKKLEKLGKEFDNIKMRSMYSDFENCSQKAYDFLKLHLKKFESTAELYKNYYNYDYDLNSQNKEIKQKLKFLNDSIRIVKEEIDFKIKNDSVISNLKEEKIKELEKLKSKFQEVSISSIENYDVKLKRIESDYTNDVNALKIQRKSEFKKLPPENYNNNKQKIIKRYEPKFEELRISKNKKIQILKDQNSAFVSSQEKENESKSVEYHKAVSQLELDIEKKIFEREKILTNQKQNKLNELDSYEENQSSKIMKKVKAKYNLDSKLDTYEKKYQKEIEETNIEINQLLKKKATNDKIKKGVKKLFGF